MQGVIFKFKLGEFWSVSFRTGSSCAGKSRRTKGFYWLFIRGSLPNHKGQAAYPGYGLTDEPNFGSGKVRYIEKIP